MRLLKMFLCGGEFPVSEYPMGIGYLKTNCEVDDWKIEIVQSKDDLKDCDMIGLSANAWGIKEAVEFNNQTDIPVILGGQGTMWDPIENQPFKHIVKGEGENALKKILRGEATEKILHEPLMPIEEMNKLNSPDRGYIKKIAPILSSRGCPFKCSFCSTIKHWPSARFHSAEYFIEEVDKIMYNYPRVRKLYIMDDLFVAHKKRLRQIYEMWMKKPYSNKLEIHGFIRSDIFTDEVAQIMYNMGMRVARFGGESASNRILKLLNKGETVEDHINAIEVCHRNGLQPSATWMYDIPGETPEEKQMTLDFIKNHDVKLGGWYKFIPFPGTPFWGGEDLTKTDMRNRDNQESKKMNAVVEKNREKKFNKTNNGVIEKKLVKELGIDHKI